MNLQVKNGTKKIEKPVETGFPIVKSLRVSNGLVSCRENNSQYSLFKYLESTKV